MAMPITKEAIEIAQRFLKRAVMEGWPVEHIVVPATSAPVRPGHIPEVASQEARDLAAHRAGMHPMGPSPQDVMKIGSYEFDLTLLPPSKTFTSTRQKLGSLTANERTILLDRYGPQFIEMVAGHKASELMSLARQALRERTKVTRNGKTTYAPALPVRPIPGTPELPTLPPVPSDWFKAPIGRIPDLVIGTPSQASIEDQLWGLLPPLTAHQLMCPVCHKQMKIGLTVLVNHQLGQFSLHCCFGSANLTSITRAMLDEQRKPSVETINNSLQELRSRHVFGD